MLGAVLALMVLGGATADPFPVNEWIALENVPRTLKQVAMASDGQELILVGGSHQDGHEITYTFDLKTGKWDAAVPKRKVAGGYSGLINVYRESTGESATYLFGGRHPEGDDHVDAEESCKSVQKFNHGTRQWELEPGAGSYCVAQPALAYRVNQDDEGIYMCGGLDTSEGSREAVNNCYRYDLASGKWATTGSWGRIAPLPEESEVWGAASCYHAASDTWYIIGGINETLEDADGVPRKSFLKAVRTLDFSAAVPEWEVGQRAPLPEASGELGAAICTEDYIYVIGGADENGAKDTVFAYDIKENEWTPGPSMPVAKETYPVLVDDSFIVVAGGEGDGDKELASVFMLPISTKENALRSNLESMASALSAQNVGENAPTSSGSEKKGRSGGEKFGIAVLVIVLIVGAVVGGFFAFRWYKSRKNLSFQKYDTNNPNAGAGMGSA